MAVVIYETKMVAVYISPKQDMLKMTGFVKAVFHEGIVYAAPNIHFALAISGMGLKLIGIGGIKEPKYIQEGASSFWVKRMTDQQEALEYWPNDPEMS
jgi:hypothetical protein